MHNAKQAERIKRLRKQTEIALPIIRDYYQIGLALLNEKALDERLKLIYERLHKDTKAKIRRFANPENGGYTKKQLEELLKLCENEELPFPLGFKLVERLLSVPISRRERLQKLMVKKGWRRRELDHQIALIRPNANWKGGRRVERLPSSKSVLPELWHMSKEWADRADNIANSYPGAITELCDADRNRFTKATAMIQKLKQSLAIHLRKVPTSDI